MVGGNWILRAFPNGISGGIKILMRNGPYILIIAPSDYPGKSIAAEYAHEHTVVFWRHTRKVPDKGFEIHHLNGNNTDNRFDNLLLVTSANSRKLHGAQKSLDAQIIMNCGWCAKELKFLKSAVKTRSSRNKSGKIFCNASCGAKHQYFMIRTGGE